MVPEDPRPQNSAICMVLQQCHGAALRKGLTAVFIGLRNDPRKLLLNITPF